MPSPFTVVGRTRTCARSATAGIATFAAVYTIDVALAHFGLHAEATIIDEVLLGTLVALLVLFIERQHENEVRAERDKVSANQYIRNALQVIVYANTFNPVQGSAQEVKQAANRIEWTLREFLPLPSLATSTRSKQGRNLPPGGLMKRNCYLP